MTTTPSSLVTTATLVSMIVGLLIPAALAFVTRASIPLRVKTLVTLALTALSGVVASVVTWPSTGSGWEHLALNVVMTFLAAAGADPNLWKPPSGYVASIHLRTDRHFGLGHYDPNLVLTA